MTDDGIYTSSVIHVQYHVDRDNDVTWYAWTDPTGTYIGREGRSHDGGPSIYVYLDETCTTLFIGPHGDPTKDLAAWRKQ